MLLYCDFGWVEGRIFHIHLLALDEDILQGFSVFLSFIPLAEQASFSETQQKQYMHCHGRKTALILNSFPLKWTKQPSKVPEKSAWLHYRSGAEVKHEHPPALPSRESQSVGLKLCFFFPATQRQRLAVPPALAGSSSLCSCLVHSIYQMKQSVSNKEKIQTSERWTPVSWL